MSYTYSSDNTRHYKQDAKGHVTAYTYDILKRITKIQEFPTGLSHAEDVSGLVLSLFADPSPQVVRVGRVQRGFRPYLCSGLVPRAPAKCRPGGDQPESRTPTRPDLVYPAKSFDPARPRAPRSRVSSENLLTGGIAALEKQSIAMKSILLPAPSLISLHS